MDKRQKSNLHFFSYGKKHDFKLFKGIGATKESCGVTESGYTDIKKLQSSSRLPKKSNKKKILNNEIKEDKSRNFFREDCE